MGHFFRFLFSKVFIINLLLAVIFIGGGLYATLYYLSDYTRHEEILKVPNLIGSHESDIEDLIEVDDEFKYQINDSIFVEGKAGGTVVEQIPAANKEVKSGRKIYLTIAARQQPTSTMPRLVDRSLRQATSLMETYGFQLGTLKYKPDLCVNCVLEQTMKGIKVKEGDRIRKGSVIDLLVGQGLSNELVNVPYLIDFTVEMAEDLLNANSLNIGIPVYDESVKTAEDTIKAKVYKQLPFFSRAPIVRMGSSVDIFLTVDTNRIIHNVKPSDTLYDLNDTP